MTNYIHVPLFGLPCAACGFPAVTLIVGVHTREVHHRHQKFPCHPGPHGAAHLGVPLGSDWEIWQLGWASVTAAMVA